MTDESNEPTNMAEEVAKRVLDLLQPKFEHLEGEIRSRTKALGEDIDAINARLTADKASVDEQFNGVRQEISGLRQDQNGLRQDISRLGTATKAQLDSHTSRFRAIGERLDGIEAGQEKIVKALDRAGIPVS